MRLSIAILVTIITSVIPNVISFINLIGSFSGTSLGFIFPSLFYIRVKGYKNISNSILIANVLIILFGIFGGFYSFYASI